MRPRIAFVRSVERVPLCVVTGSRKTDPTVNLRGAIAAVWVRNPSRNLDPSRIGELMRAIHATAATVSSEFALKLLPLTCCAPRRAAIGRMEGVRP